MPPPGVSLRTSPEPAAHDRVSGIALVISEHGVAVQPVHPRRDAAMRAGMPLDPAGGTVWRFVGALALRVPLLLADVAELRPRHRAVAREVADLAAVEACAVETAAAERARCAGGIPGSKPVAAWL